MVSSTGRVVGNFRAALFRVEGHWVWYRRHWHSTVFTSIGQPVLFLAAMGIGFGSQVHADAATGGLPYLVYLAPALLVASAMQVAVGESSYPVLSGFKWQKDFLAVTATPITSGQLLAGQLIWVGLRLLLAGVGYLAIAACFGALSSLWVLLALPVALLVGLACGALVMALAATITTDGNAFNALFRFVVMPMTLFAGTFFPVSSIPAFLRPLAWITPLWHGTALARAAAFGGMGMAAVLAHVAYLVVLLVLGVLLARWRFRRRLVV
ncbi:MAG: ABC transporter permease [Sciscionella sp.]